MRALVFDGRLDVRDVPVPARSPETVLVRVTLAGICGTDLEIVRGYKQFRGVLGHEFVGEVVAARNSALVGRRVCGEINVWCGDCDMCDHGLHTHCLNRTVLGILGHHGAFAEYVDLPACNLHLVPDGVSDEQAVFTEPLAAAFQILEQAPPEPGDRVVILGDGRLGLLCAMALHSAGFEPLTLGRHPEKLAMLAARGLAARTVLEGLPSSVDYVVEATGSPSGFETAVEMLRPRGTLALKSTVAEPAPIDLSPVVVKEIRIVGSRCGPFDRALAALADRSVDPGCLVDSTYDLSDGVAALSRAATPGVLKVLLRP